jgi:hypothetical protein
MCSSSTQDTGGTMGRKLESMYGFWSLVFKRRNYVSLRGMEIFDRRFCKGCYFQEGKTVNMKTAVQTALWRAMKRWAQWVLWHLKSEKTRVFLSNYAPVHFR